MYMYVWTYLGLTRCEEAYDGIQPPMVPIVWTPSRGGSPEVYPAGRRGGVRASLGQFRTLDATCACVLGHGAPRSGAAGGGGGGGGTCAPKRPPKHQMDTTTAQPQPLRGRPISEVMDSCGTLSMPVAKPNWNAARHATAAAVTRPAATPPRFAAGWLCRRRAVESSRLWEDALLDREVATDGVMALTAASSARQARPRVLSVCIYRAGRSKLISFTEDCLIK